MRAPSAADSINENTETHGQKVKTQANTINNPVHTGVNNQNPDSLSPLIDPRFASIERPRNPRTPSGVVPLDMKTLLATLACLLVLLSLAACGDDDDEDTSTPTASASAPATATRSATTPAATTAATTIAATTTAVTATPPQNVCLANPNPTTPDINNVTAPLALAQVTSPVQITGQIAAFEAVFQVTIYDAQGNEIVDQFAMSNEGQTLAPFSVSIPFSVAQATPACLWVYELSAQDGSPIHIVQIPVTLLP